MKIIKRFAFSFVNSLKIKNSTLFIAIRQLSFTTFEGVYLSRKYLALRSAFPSVNQSLLEMREAIAVGISKEVSALKEGRRDVKVLCWGGARGCWRPRIEAWWAHAAQVIVVTDWFLLAANLHFFVLLVAMFPVNLLKLHCDFAQLLQRLPCQHHLLAVPHIAVKELLHHIHVINYECVKSLEISRWIKLSDKIDFEWRVVDRFAATCVLICLVAAGKLMQKIIFKSRDSNLFKELTKSIRHWWMHTDETCLSAACYSHKFYTINPPTLSPPRSLLSGCKAVDPFEQSANRRRSVRRQETSCKFAEAKKEQQIKQTRKLKSLWT